MNVPNGTFYFNLSKLETPMANVFRTTQYTLDDVFIRYKNYLSFALTANRNLEGDFKDLQFATGQTINYRLEERYLGGEGATATSEARVQVIRPLSIAQQFHTMVDYSGFNLTFDRARDEPYLEMANNPRAKRLANLTENYIAENFANQVYFATGTSGTPIDFNALLQTDALMTSLAIPEDGRRYAAVGPYAAANLSNSLYNTFNNTVNTGALIDGFIGHLTGFDIFKTVFLKRQIAGLGEAGGTPPAGFKLAGTVTNGPISGGNQIALTGLVASSVVFNKGDRLQLSDSAGVFLVNPLTYDSLTTAAQFVVQDDVVISSSGGTATVTVSPEIVVSGARQNISAAIPNGAQLLMRTDHNVNLAYHSQALVFAAPPMKELRGGVEAVTRFSDLYKLALTYSLGADIRNYQQLDRIDLICGVAINPEFAICICS